MKPRKEEEMLRSCPFCGRKPYIERDKYFEDEDKICCNHLFVVNVRRFEWNNAYCWKLVDEQSKTIDEQKESIARLQADALERNAKIEELENLLMKTETYELTTRHLIPQIIVEGTKIKDLELRFQVARELAIKWFAQSHVDELNDSGGFKTEIVRKINEDSIDNDISAEVERLKRLNKEVVE